MTNAAPNQFTYPIAANEEERLQEILTYDFHDRGAQASLDLICVEVQRFFKVPVALITLVGRDDQTFLAKCGVDAAGTSRKDSFCTYTILNDEVFVVADATKDARFNDNPFVTGEMHIRFYAGAPLTVRPGVRIGSVCLIDTSPRTFTVASAARLQMFAGLAVNEIRGRRLRIDLEKQQTRLSQTVKTARAGVWRT